MAETTKPCRWCNFTRARLLVVQWLGALQLAIFSPNRPVAGGLSSKVIGCKKRLSAGWLRNNSIES